MASRFSDWLLFHMRSLLCFLTASFCRIVFFEHFQTCMRCGKPRHPTPAQCPVRSTTCYRCKIIGHYGTCCISKTVANIIEEPELSDTDADFLDMIATNESKAWLKTVKSKKVFFTLSTGKLEKPSKVLHGPAGKKLEVLGQFEGNLSHGSRHIR